MEKSIYSPKHRQLADLLRRLRTDAGLTQQEVAARLGRHHPFIHDYETGQRRLDVVRLRDVARALETTLGAIVEDLVGIADESTPRTGRLAAASTYPTGPDYQAEWSRLCTLLLSLRTAAGLTEVEVAERLNEPQSFVSKYETMQRRLDLIELEQVAAALDTTLVDMVAEFERGSETTAG